MPWQLDGTFLRVNPDYSESPSGELWGKDLKSTPSIKIIASRHDWHDHDLGQGIEECLNIDGLNAMRANLDMGGFKIINTVDGTNNTDYATFGQVAGDLEFDTGTRILSLLNNNGVLIDTVNIPSGTGGGGEGTVSSITIGAGLTGSANPITTTGNIALEFLGSGQSYTGGIQTIVVDNYGRVTQVIPGAFGDPPISIDQNFTDQVEVSSGNGTPGIILEATPSRAGVMTADMVTLLNSLAGGGMIPPIKLYGINKTPQAGLGTALTGWTDKTTETFVAADGWVDIISLTGSGLVEYCALVQEQIATLGLIDVAIVIDGVTDVWTADNLFDEGVTINDDGINLIGSVDASTTDLLALQQVKFNSEFRVAAISNQPNNSRLAGYIKWQKYT